VRASWASVGTGAATGGAGRVAHPALGWRRAPQSVDRFHGIPGVPEVRFAHVAPVCPVARGPGEHRRRREPLRVPHPPENTTPEQRYGPARLSGLEPVRQIAAQRLADAVEERLPQRFAETGRGEPDPGALERAAAELSAIFDAGLAELLLIASLVAAACRERNILVAARGSATSSPVVWALGLVELCPLDYRS
jgi:Bacterial DNA polymerase III alpha NTPase domain